MNYGELKDAILSDSHREDYTNDVVERFVKEAEAMIYARLNSYALEYELTDDDRVSVGGAIYTLPQRTVQVRHVIPPDCKPLTQADESLVAMSADSSTVRFYTVRPTTLVIAGTPAEDATFQLLYFGLPAPLSVDADTNALLRDFPQLYKEAAQVPLFKRAKDYEAAQIAFQSTNSLIDTINRMVKRMIGGAQSAPRYNTSFRSSY